MSDAQMGDRRHEDLGQMQAPDQPVGPLQDVAELYGNGFEDEPDMCPFIDEVRERGAMPDERTA